VIRRVKEKIDNYNPLRDGVGKIGVINVTGPIPYTHKPSFLFDRCIRIV
jgi:hypothetical protein